MDRANSCAAKSFVMAMLYMKVPLSVPHLELWVKSGNKR